MGNGGRLPNEGSGDSGVGDGSNWMEKLPPAQRSQWQLFFSHAEQTILKNKDVAGLRPRVNAASEVAPLQTLTCPESLLLPSLWVWGVKFVCATGRSGAA